MSGVSRRTQSTCKGTVVFLEQIIRETASVIHDPEQTNLEFSIAAIKTHDMAANYNFNRDRMTSFEGDTGPYLLYAHVSLSSRKDPELLPLPASEKIAFFLETSPDVVRTALRTHELSGVVTFAFGLAHAISSAWDTVVVKGDADVNRARARIWLYVCARDVLGLRWSC
jgi:arginyl-tRNA synthetase